jgi:leucyl/phenylalanyl-tRNA--protein transferase
MPLYVLDKDLEFPPAELADEDGLLAIGGDLSMERLKLAYRKGIFPWYEDQYILWWCPNPRFVLFPGELKISNSMKQVLKKGELEFSVDRNFGGVISACKSISRRGQQGTWISDDMRNAYVNLHRHGYAHSAEAWLNGELVGGLYGVRLGNVFFGESMFSKVSNASKFAFIRYVQQLISEGVQLIDCQVYTAHLESLGAKMIARGEFLGLVDALVEG